MKLYYCRGNRNLGDIVNRRVFEEVLDIRVVPSTYFDADVFGIGSILEKAFIHNKPQSNALRNWWRNRKKYSCLHRGEPSPIYIFGSGFMRDEGSGLKAYRDVEVLALRGEKTKKIMEKILGVDLSSVPLGDPGLLMNRLVSPCFDKKYRTGIISHYKDADNPLIKRLLERNNQSVIIDIMGDPIVTLNKINECEFILSSAMHGLIAADSLNIPNQWIKVSDKLMGGDFKFQDYYSAFNLKASAWDLRGETNLEINLSDLRSKYKITPEAVERINARLINVFQGSCFGLKVD